MFFVCGLVCVDVSLFRENLKCKCDVNDTCRTRELFCSKRIKRDLNETREIENTSTNRYESKKDAAKNQSRHIFSIDLVKPKHVNDERWQSAGASRGLSIEILHYYTRPSHDTHWSLWICLFLCGQHHDNARYPSDPVHDTNAAMYCAVRNGSDQHVIMPLVLSLPSSSYMCNCSTPVDDQNVTNRTLLHTASQRRETAICRHIPCPLL